MKKRITRTILSLIVVLSLMGGMATVSFAASWGLPTCIDIVVDGQPYTLNGYNVEGYDYYRLTDIAYVLRNAKEKSFDLAEQNGRWEWKKGQPFSSDHRLLTSGDISLLQNTATFTTQSFYIEGVRYTHAVSKISDELYMRLADVAQVLDIAMVYANDTAVINSSMGFLTNLQEISDEGYFDFLHGSIVGDLNGQVYYECKADEKAAIASTSKIMTYLLVMEAIASDEISMTDLVKVSAEAARLSRTEDRELRDLPKGDHIPLPQLLDVMMVCSSNEAAAMLAEHVSATEADFVALMNQRAVDLGLHTAEFHNAHGLPVYTPDLLSAKRQNRMSARDLYKLSCYVLEKYPQILEITSKESVTAESAEGFSFTGNTTNRLMFQVANIDGLKTGTTNRAGACQVGTMKASEGSDTSQYIAVVLGAEDNLERYGKTGMLLQYADEKATGRQTEVIAFSPSGNNVPRAGQIEMVFTDRMEQTKGEITLNGQALTSFRWSSDGKHLSVPYSGLSSNTTHNIELKGFVSEIGSVADTALAFTTESSGSSGSSGSGKGSSSTDQGVVVTSAPGVYAPAVTAEKGLVALYLDHSTVSTLTKDSTKNGSVTVSIAPKISGDLTKLSVTMPLSSLSSFVAGTDAALAVTCDLAEVSIPHSALKDIVSQAKGSGNVSFSIEKGSIIVDIIVDGQSLTALSGGVSVSLPASSAGTGTVAVKINSDGSQEILPKSVAAKGTLIARLEGSTRIDRLDNGKVFDDVVTTHWAYEPITFVAARELLQGTGKDTFSAGTGMTRGMLVTVLHRMESEPGIESTLSTDSSVQFKDIDLSQWYGNAVTWASGNHIVSGIDEQTFAPNREITRAELVTMIYRYGSYLGLDMSVSGTLDDFSDAEDVQAWAAPAMSWAVGSGLISGNERSELSPHAHATRAEVSSIIQRLITNMIK